jgi:hypothetical protein
MTDEELKQRYFTPSLPAGKREAQYTIRILPGKPGERAFKSVWFHEIEIPGGKAEYGKSKIYDPGRNEGKRSPITEVYEELMKEDAVKNKELAKKYLPKEFYIAKVIDRNNESDGPKFWRFKRDMRGQGIMDKIMALWKAKGSLADPEKGRDIIITVIEAVNPLTKKTYPSVNSIIYDDVSLLHSDAATAQAWIEEPTTWEDVYSKKPVEYLEAIARGETPRWDNTLNKYVYGDSSVSETTIGGVKEPDVDPQQSDDADNDLPF